VSGGARALFGGVLDLVERTIALFGDVVQDPGGSASTCALRSGNSGRRATNLVGSCF